MNYEIANDEIVLYTGTVGYEKSTLNTLFTLTSKKMIFEKEKGVFKKTKELIDIIPLEDIKVFNEEVQSKQKFNEIHVQTVKKNFTIYLFGIIEAKNVNSKIINAISGTTTMERGSKKVKNTLDIVDDTLGINSRNIVKGVLENGIKGTLISGIKNKRKDK